MARSLNQQGISVREKPVLFLHCLAVCFHDQIVPSESGAEHQQCALWGMKVCDQCIRNFEIILREDELVGPTVVGFECFCGAHRRFHGTHSGSTNRDDALAFFFGAVDTIRTGFGDDQLFRINLVLGEVFDFYRSERSKADVLGEERHVNAFDFETL